jgi:ribosomal protein S18 acetylase RimI-like enzyme
MVLLDHCINNLSVQRLLALCIFEPIPEKLAELTARYDSMPNWALYGLHIDETLAGVVGVRTSTQKHILIQHIAVAPEAQRQGIGRRLIEHLIHVYQFYRLEAETDGDAVEFYRSCGFAVHNLGEVYSGVERFPCVLESPTI